MRHVAQVAPPSDSLKSDPSPLSALSDLADALERNVEPASRTLLVEFAQRREELSGDELTTSRGTTPLVRTSLSGTKVPRVALPRFSEEGELLRWLRSENLPGSFPFTAGVFPFKRDTEDPARMFAGEGDPFRTNRRFHMLSEGQPATRLSTAFDSVTLYGRDPDTPPTSTARSVRRGFRWRRSRT